MKAKDYFRKIKSRRIILLLIITLLVIILILIRNASTRQIDDVNPNRFCETEFVDKSQTLMIIPLLNNISIANNKSWCEYVLSLNKTLGMHGIYHDYNEFSFKIEEENVREGMEEFNKCFGFYPAIFEAPRLVLSRENNNLLREMGFEIRGYGFNVFHKVYHCVNFEKTSYLVKLNKFIDIF